VLVTIDSAVNFDLRSRIPHRITSWLSEMISSADLRAQALGCQYQLATTAYTSDGIMF